MLSFERSKGFQHKCDCLESLKTQTVQKTTRVSKTSRSIENHKTMKSPGNQELRRSGRVRKSARVKEDCQVSRNQNLKSLEDWQATRVKNQENNS